MSIDSYGSLDPPGEPKPLARAIRSCSICGAKFSATAESEFCPVCLLQGVLGGEVESKEFVFKKPVKRARRREAQRFDHYEMVLGEDGRPLELGRGAMGITYKAVDVDLHCPVTLKVISQKYLREETARVRFIREARAAASVRHPNVASVFHLGRKRRDYFYAMEFVEGETLDSLIRRSGRLEVKLALEITRQVASGLSAVHKKKLVHRDIKPSNVMVSFEEDGAVTAKIIDLGLAKVMDETAAQTTISASGAFAGTPEFASPEQIVGGEVDIRTDLYALGISFWQMLTGHVPFGGSVAAIIAQHLHTALPLEKLQGFPQSVISLIEVLLDKDPARRFQTPAELLKALPPVIAALEEGSTITYQGSRQIGDKELSSITRKPQASAGPEKISIARLPVTGSDLFGREEDIAFLDAAWANPDVNLVTIVAWAGVGKSTLINHWLRAMAAQHYRSAELVFGWSFYRQGTSGGTSSADEFIDAALTWFGDSDARMGTAWEKAERLAKLISHRRTLLVLDGMEPLQNPPGSQEGRLRNSSLQALLKELAAFNTGLCVITTRLPIADIADHERSSAPRRDLEHLSSDAGAKLLQALGVRGDQAELRTASDEFGGHCLALTLLGSYLTDAYNGDIRCRKEVSGDLSHDVRQGAHARKVMESYQAWFGEGPELSVLRILGLFDRPTGEKPLGALLNPPAIPGLTEALTSLRPTEWRTIVARLRRARLLAAEDPHNPGQFDTHPLVREYFGEQLRYQRTEAWKECNRRLFYYYQKLSPPLPNSFSEMEPLFLAVICGCHAGLFRDALHEVYIPRIQRGDTCFAAMALGARSPLLSVLVHFFEQGRWGSPAKAAVEEQSLTGEDQLFILMQAAAYLTATRGVGAPENRICFEHAESLCHSLGRPLVFRALIAQWRYVLVADKLSAAMQIAKRLYAVAEQQDDSTLTIWAHNALAATHFFLGNFESAREHAISGVRTWQVQGSQFHPQDVDTPSVGCLCYKAFSEWHLGETDSCRAKLEEAISLANELKDTHALTIALGWAMGLAEIEHNPAEVDRLASLIIELSTRDNFAQHLAEGCIHRGWARSALGDTTQGIVLIEQGIRDFRATGSVLSLPYYLSLKAGALYLADRTTEALEAIDEAQKVIERSEERQWSAELHRLRGVFLATTGANETQIEASFHEAIRIARGQKSVALATRGEASCAEYRRQKSDALSGRQLRLPIH
jgi:serine/threonine protein kinase/tetratricopeptide (TPR) repeat protein